MNQRNLQDTELEGIDISQINYKDTKTLSNFLSNQGKILPRRLTGVTAKQQRQLAKAVKQARILGFLQFLYKE